MVTTARPARTARPRSPVAARARRLWPVAATLAVAVAGQQILAGRYDVSGHAAEHLGAAYAPFFALVAVTMLLVTTPGGRRRPLVVASAAAWLASTVAVAAGNLRVVDSLVAAGLGHVPTSELVVDEALEAAHGLANLAPWLGVAAAVLLAVTARAARQVRGRVAAASAVLSVIFPPWLVPGAGVLVLVAARTGAFWRDREPDR